MLGLSKFVVNSLRVWNNAAKVAVPKMSPIMHARTMETFAQTWEKDLGKALSTARTIKKPIMLVVYRPWCTYCQNLSRDMSKSLNMKQLEQYFIMAQVNEDETYLDNKFAPDGGVRYVPRVLFLTPEGEVMRNVKNHKSYKDGTLYVYNDVNDIMNSMNQVVRNYVMARPSDTTRRGRSSRARTTSETSVETGPSPTTITPSPPAATTGVVKKNRKNTRRMTTATIRKR